MPRTALVAGVLVAAGLTAHGQLSPTGTWDVVLKGQQKGIAQLTFNPDFTITGFEIITVKPGAPTDPNERNNGDGESRTPTTSSTNSTPVTNFFGRALISGNWSFEGSGKILGTLVEYGSTKTNGISFRGKVTSSQRLNFVGYHGTRSIHYRGVPLTTLPDISGNFYTTGTKDGAQYVEMFSLVPDTEPNTYLVSGVGPAYDFIGSAVLSSQKQLAISSLQAIGTNGVLSAVTGSFNSSKGRGSLNGVDELYDRVTAKVQRQ